MDKMFILRCDESQRKKLRRILKEIQKETGENQVQIILRALFALEKRGQIDY